MSHAFQLGPMHQQHCRRTASEADHKTLLLARVCLGLDCHEFSSEPSHV